MSRTPKQGEAVEEREMDRTLKRSSTRVLRLMVGLALLGWPAVVNAQGASSDISRE